MYPRTRQLAARVRAFVDWVIELYAQECQLAEQFVEEMLRDAGASVSPAPAATGPGS
jgi:hypothetical protein